MSSPRTAVVGPGLAPWRSEAACKGMPTDWWFPPDDNWCRARAICARCPARIDCREHALNVEPLHYDTAHGMWGGLTPSERRSETKRRRAAERQVRRIFAELREVYT